MCMHSDLGLVLNIIDKRYFKDRWLIMDTAIILLSLFFVLFEMYTTLRNGKNIISII